MIIRKAILRAWYSPSYTADVQMGGSGRSYLQGIKVSRSIPSAEMVPGRLVAIVFWDKTDVQDAVIFAVYA